MIPAALFARIVAEHAASPFTDVLTGVLAIVIAGALTGICSYLYLIGRDLRELRDEFHGDPDRGEKPIRVELAEIRQVQQRYYPHDGITRPPPHRR